MRIHYISALFMIDLTAEELKQYFSDDIFKRISETADELGLECYVVGGYVRDIFLQRPSKDIDVVVVGSGIAMAEALGKRLGRGAHVSVFKNFGTAQLKYYGTEVEFVGARKESYTHDSRKPIVEDGTLEDDQNRRDFTINALAVCLNRVRYGELVDPFGGIGDLKEKTIRTPLDPDITFSDDPLRMMRCVRFATQLGFYIDDETFDSLERNRERISIISKERIADELNKIILSPIPSKGFIELDRCGLLELIFPELVRLQGVETRNGRSNKYNFYHTLEVLDNISKKTDNLWLRWAALLHDIGKPSCFSLAEDGIGHFFWHSDQSTSMAESILSRLRFDNASKEQIVRLVRYHDMPITADRKPIKRLLSKHGEDATRQLIELHKADTLGQSAICRHRIAIFEEVSQMINEILQEESCFTLKDLAVNGHDMMTLGFQGPTIGRVLQECLDAVLDEQIPNEHEALMAFAKDRQLKS